MKKEILNGTRIPYELSVEELSKMLSSPIMKDFSLACEALSYKNDAAAYETMKSYINDKDKYRRLYILKTIFRHPNAVELIDFLENAITSDDSLFVENGLIVISEYGIKVSDSLLLLVVTKHLPNLYTAIRSLNTLDICEENYTKLTALFSRAEQCVQKEVIGEVLADKYLPSKSKELFELFSHDRFAKIRLLAIKIAKEHGYNLSAFLSDMDGHVKKLATKFLGELSFLSAYISQYRIDVSDDLESAIIYNPNSEDHLYIEYDKADEFSPYMLSFSFQHVHLTDEESAKEWIDFILSEDVFSIEYFCGEDRRFGGQISAKELSNLSYDYLEQDTGYYGITKLFQIVDHFKIRGWSRKNDFDGCFVEKGNTIQIDKIGGGKHG
ncbi:MAG: hypothetical protein IKM34_00870 [Clostridia bacterium]|nr:hypothetical protein [Clostridia bacterium]